MRKKEKEMKELIEKAMKDLADNNQVSGKRVKYLMILIACCFLGIA